MRLCRGISLVTLCHVGLRVARPSARDLGFLPTLLARAVAGDYLGQVQLYPRRAFAR